MAYISIPGLNVLRFFRTDNQGSNIQNFDNRGMYQEDYPDYKEFVYYQKVKTTDGILIQITTNSTTRNLKMYDSDDSETDLTSGWSIITSWNTSDYDTVTVYQQAIDTSLLGGYYYFILEFDSGETYQSEWVEVISDASDMVKYSYTHSETGQHKGVYFSGTQTFTFRVEARFVKYGPGINRITGENFNENLLNINSNALRVVELELFALPRFIIEKVNQSLQCDTIKINDIEYETEDGLDAEIVGANTDVTNLYTGSIEFRQKNYEVYEELYAEEDPETFNIDINEDGDDLTDGTDPIPWTGDDNRIYDYSEEATRDGNLFIAVDKTGFTESRRILLNKLSPIIDDLSEQTLISTAERLTGYMRANDGLGNENKIKISNIANITSEYDNVSVLGTRKIRVGTALGSEDAHVTVDDIMSYISDEFYTQEYSVDAYNSDGSTRYGTIHVVQNRYDVVVVFDPLTSTSGEQVAYDDTGTTTPIDLPGALNMDYFSYVNSQSKDPNTGKDNMIRVMYDGVFYMDIDEPERAISLTYTRIPI